MTNPFIALFTFRLCPAGWIFLILTGHSSAQVQKISPVAGGAVQAQPAGVLSPVMTSTLYASAEQTGTGDKWAISVRPTYSRKHTTDEIGLIKAAKEQQKLQSLKITGAREPDSRAVQPKILVNFEANWSVESTPPDNTIAVSNGGYIVTANNDGVEYYNTSGAFLYFDYWSDFFNDNTLTASLYDPRVIYDSGADRFVMVLLHGSSASTSRLLVCFSKTNSPLNGWWIYKLTGNPLDNNCWFDYPALGVSTNEIYITGNLFRTQGPFQETVIYQIPKSAGYTGGTLSWQYWSGLSTTPFSAFSLVPAVYGHQGNYGPGIYLVSNRSSGDTRIRLWDITDDMSGSPELLSYTVSTTEYSPAPDAYQSGSTDRLDNGDCRIQNAFYLDGTIHFVFHSDIGDGWNGINYNRLKVNTTTNESGTFGLKGSYDYSYPAVASFATNPADQSVMVAFLRVSSSTFPSVRVVNCDQGWNWSPSELIKAGETFVDFLSSSNERWGDFTGIARRHNSPEPRVWLAGCYGANIPSQQTSNTFKTWVAEIAPGPAVSVEASPQIRDFSLFPNPAYDLVQVVFSLERREQVTIELADMQGRVFKVLYSDIPRADENRLTFNRSALSNGTYILTIRTASQVLRSEKVIVAD